MRISTRNRTFQQWHQEISRLPKNLTLFKASRRLRVCYPYASVKLKQHGYKPLETRGGFNGQRKIPLATVRRINWKLRDARLARKYKVSREWMRQLRGKLGKPKVGRRKS